MNKLTHSDIHLLRLVRQGQDDKGWAKVSTMVLPLIQKLSDELVEIVTVGEGAIAKLTEKGNTVIDCS